MKRILIILAVVAGLTGCVITDPYYVQPVPVIIQPRAVYIVPPVYYRQTLPVYYRQPTCYWVQRWDSQYRVTRDVRVCR